MGSGLGTVAARTGQSEASLRDANHIHVARLTLTEGRSGRARAHHPHNRRRDHTIVQLAIPRDAFEAYAGHGRRVDTGSGSSSGSTVLIKPPLPSYDTLYRLADRSDEAIDDLERSIRLSTQNRWEKILFGIAIAGTIATMWAKGGFADEFLITLGLGLAVDMLAVHQNHARIKGQRKQLIDERTKLAKIQALMATKVLEDGGENEDEETTSSAGYSS